MNLVILIYYHPEFFPPTLNAILNLSKTANSITVVTRNTLRSGFSYPENVKIIALGPLLSAKQIENKNIFWKIKSFLIFTIKALSVIKKVNANWIIAYDPVPLFSVFLMRSFISNVKIWYHNHDIFQIKFQRKFSIGWFAAKFERNSFSFLDVFSLPSIERLKYFPSFNNKRTQFYYIPNYPSLYIYRKYKCDLKSLDKGLVLIFQGTIGPAHALEETIRLIAKSKGSLPLKLYLKGPVQSDYKKELLELAEEQKIRDEVEFFDITPYEEVPKLTAKAHVGLALHMGHDVMNKTLGTASNKIYEYIAVGLPVILYDNEHFRHHCEKYEWAFFSDGSETSLASCIDRIKSNYSYYSEVAKRDFLQSLNFEFRFNEVVNLVFQEDAPKSTINLSAVKSKLNNLV